MEPMNDQPQNPAAPQPAGHDHTAEQPADQANNQAQDGASSGLGETAAAQTNQAVNEQAPSLQQAQAQLYQERPAPHPAEAPQAAPNGVPQWIPAAPPQHPYAAAAAGSVPGGGKGLVIAAMAVGLVALLTVCVSFAYFNALFAVAGGVLGIVAVVLAVVGLVKRFRPLGASITGVAAGALAMIAVTVLLGAGLLAPGSATPEAGDPAAAGEEWQPGAEQESLLNWPANMATGGIVFEGPGDPLPKPSDPLAAGTSPQPNEVDRETGNDILIYVDYRCPHCGEFEHQNGEYLTELLEAGDTSIEIVPLSFLDRASEGSYYSSRAAGMVACLASAQPEAAWNAHAALLSPEIMPSSGAGPTNEQLISAVEQRTGTLNNGARECITSEAYVPFAQALNAWVFQNPVPNTLASDVRVEGTPTIVVNGEVFAGDPSDPASFRAFVEGLTN